MGLFLNAECQHQTGSLGIMSYNVCNARGMDEKVDYDRIAAVIKGKDPSIVALQELDSVAARSVGLDVLKEIATRAGYHYVYGAAVDFEGGKYGVGVMSKEIPLNTTNIPLPGSEEKRNLQIVEFSKYFFFCVHLSLTAADRLTSTRIIHEQALKKSKPILLAGDFNARPSSEEILFLKKNNWQLLSGEQFTFPANNPDRCIDYIFAYDRRAVKAIKTEVVNEPMASDHRPVMTIISAIP